jgi:CDP-diacylglycerol--glycerol-3-phosphate 3-phosphatidyltransferase
LLRPLSRLLYDFGVTANQVTLTALCLSLLTGIALILKASQPRILLLLVAALLLRVVLNALGSMLVKEFALKSRFGAILSELCDVFSDAALYLPLALGWHFAAWLVVPVVVLAIISEMTGVLGLMVGSGRRYDGPMGRSEQAIVFALVALAIGFGVPMGLILLGYTIYNRANTALRRDH